MVKHSPMMVPTSRSRSWSWSCLLSSPALALSLVTQFFPKRLTRLSLVGVIAIVLLTIHLGHKVLQPSHHVIYHLPPATADPLVHGQYVSETPIPLEVLQPFPISPAMFPPPPLSLLRPGSYRGAEEHPYAFDDYNNNDVEGGPYAPAHSRGPDQAPWLTAVMVSSSDAARRMMIRSTWMRLYRDVPFAGRFVVCNPGPMWTETIRAENRTFGDIIVLDHLHEDGMTAHTIKTLETWKWLQENGQQYAFVSKMDSDLFLNARAFWERYLLPRLANDTIASNPSQYANAAHHDDNDRDDDDDDDDIEEGNEGRLPVPQTPELQETPPTTATHPGDAEQRGEEQGQGQGQRPGTVDDSDFDRRRRHNRRTLTPPTPGIPRASVERTIIGQLYYSEQHDLAFPHGSMYTLTWDMMELLTELQDEYHVVAGEDLALAMLMLKGRQRAHMINHSGFEKFDYDDRDARGDGTPWARKATHPNAPEHALYGNEIISVHNLKVPELWMKVAEAFDEYGLRAPPPMEGSETTPPFSLRWFDFWSWVGLSRRYESRLDRIPDVFWRFENGTWVCDGMWDVGRARTGALRPKSLKPSDEADVGGFSPLMD